MQSCDVIARAEALFSEGRLVDALRALSRLPRQERPVAAALAGRIWRAAANPEKAWEWTKTLGAPRDDSLRREWEAAREVQAQRLRANLEAAGRGNLYSPALERWLEDPAFDAAVTWAREGDCLVWLREAPSALEGLARSIDPSEREHVARLAATGNPLAIYGGVSGQVEAAHAVVPSIYLWMKRPIFVVEPDLSLFLLSLRLVDRREVLSAPGVFWFVGPGWDEAFREVLVAEPLRPLPPLSCVIPQKARDLTDVLADIERIRAADTARARERSVPFYAEAARPLFSVSGPTRVLLVTTRFSTVHQHVTRDLARAFVRRRCLTETLIERDDCERLAPPVLARAIDNFRPDIVVQLDHNRPEWGEAVPPGLPFVCWIQDRLPCLFDRRFIEKLGRFDFAFAMWEGIRRDCLAAGYTEVRLLAAAADGETYGAPARVRPEYACDVAFVSNLSPLPLREEPAFAELVARAEALLREEGIGYRDPVFYGRLLDRIAAEQGFRVAAAERSRLVERVLAFDVERYVQRTEPIRWAREMGFSIGVWGRGWDEMPEFRDLARGPIAPGEELRDLYASARVHLQMNSDTNAHARVFECLASGGFLLAWAHPNDSEPGGLGTLLEIGREVETFSGRADFEAKLRRYLADPEARAAISRAGRARVLAEQTMENRAETILSWVRERLGGPA